MCVVEESRDIVAVERTGEFRGRYHVLLGAMSPLEGIGPEQLKIRELLARIEPEGIEELIICTNPNTEGEVTAMYLARQLRPLGLTVTRPASGLPVGGDLEYADELTLGRALEGRREVTRRLTPDPAAPGHRREVARVWRMASRVRSLRRGDRTAQPAGQNPKTRMDGPLPRDRRAKMPGAPPRVGSGRTGRLEDDAPELRNRCGRESDDPIPYVSITLQNVLDQIKPALPVIDTTCSTARSPAGETSAHREFSPRPHEEGVALAAATAQRGRPESRRHAGAARGAASSTSRLPLIPIG